jgi:hypothetical protein
MGGPWRDRTYRFEPMRARNGSRLVDADIGALDGFKLLPAYLTGLLFGALLTALTASLWVPWLPYVVGP